MTTTVDNDSDIDSKDINLITIARNTPATGPNDSRDADRDGKITVLDASKCTQQCSRPKCTINNAPVAKNDTYTTAKNTPLNVAAPGVLKNDTDAENDSLTVTLVKPPASGHLTLNANGSFSYTPVNNFSGNISFTYRANDNPANSNIATAIIKVKPAVDPGLPPDPATIAPPLDQTVATNLATATSFLYTGTNPIQTGVAPGIINPKRAALLRGKVLARDNTPLTGVKITVLNHPELGQTLSRADGMFDLAVNGGGVLTVSYEKTGYLPVQRQLNTPWQDYKHLPNVVMIQLDSQVTPIDLNAATPIQVARGSSVTDSDGTRRATLLFSQGTTATVDGRTLTSLNIRATEYTIGSNGPQAMPAALPPSSGYTYAVELSADEAPGQEVRFSKPVIKYVENFLDFPVGGIVPVGYYDRVKAAWIPSDNGRVIKILSIDSSSMAELDTDGDNAADNAATLEALGVTDTERQQLATLYAAGQSLWRVPITHFSPWDCNWPYGPPTGAVPPQMSISQVDPKLDDPVCQGGSIIECQNQVLGESIGITGTPFSLNYRSDRVPGRKAAYTLNIPLSGATLPASLKRIALEISIAGRLFTESLSATINQNYTFTWDGKDAFGRSIQGGVPANVRIGYVYQAIYQTPAQLDQSFAALSGIPMTGDRGREEVTLWQETSSFLGTLESPVGRWSLNPHHSYVPTTKVLYMGNGTRHGAQATQNSIITTIAGGTPGFGGDGGPATMAQLASPLGSAVGPDGSLYIANSYNFHIRRIGPDGIITTIAGNGINGFKGDGEMATMAQLAYPRGIAVGPDGSLYIADTSNWRIRRVGLNGIITTVAGTGPSTWVFSGDGGPAVMAQLKYPSSITVGPDGSLYIPDSSNNGIRQVASVLPDSNFTDFAIASEDATELYVFNAEGRHLRTFNALTGAVRYQFGYDSAGHLISITDGDGDITSLERNTTGKPVAIIAPDGQRTVFTLDTNDYLATITNPAGEAYRMEYTADGLLISFTDPKGNKSVMTYDALGRLIKDQNAAGGFWALNRSEQPNGYTVSMTSAENRSTTYQIENLPTGDQRRLDTAPNGTQTETLIKTDGTRTVTAPDGTFTTTIEGPDPRFSMQAPFTQSLTVKLPSGLSLLATAERTADLANPDDPLSLQSQTNKMTLNGKTFTSVYDATLKQHTFSSPLNRQGVVKTDTQGRVIQQQVTGIEAVNYGYDARGRLISLAQGSGATARNATLSYNPQGYLASITDPLSRTQSYSYDASGRVTQQTLPDGRLIKYNYDANGNVTSLTPPGRSGHTFGYTPVDLESQYMPPAIGLPTTQTQYTYNLDKQLTRITRPDGQLVNFAYDSGGRLTTLATPHGCDQLHLQFYQWPSQHDYRSRCHAELHL